MAVNKIEIPILYGGAKVPFHLQNEEEKKQANQKTIERAKEKAFSRGLPIIWGKNGKIVAEYANGNKVMVIDGEITTIPYDDLK
jgi:hypothetical protein